MIIMMSFKVFYYILKIQIAYNIIILVIFREICKFYLRLYKIKELY